ncbi:GHKL domain-containing protein [Cohnella cholangitidis]|uniref:histidine kinase n=2 Tax=Cohnella cholangitidis TaxID=2598458 RepID=A0A7G5C2U1_9BACL|nr:GHKL domain-containing protein [Cohnella cholangitidis]
MQEFITFLKLDVLVAQPQTFTYLLFCFSFLDPQPPKLLRRLVLFTLIHSIYTDALILVLPLPLHLVNSILAGTILMLILFRDLRLKKRLYLLLFWFLFGICMDTTSGITLIYIIGVSSHEDLIRDDLMLMIKVMYPQLLIVLFVSWFIRKRNFFSGKRFFSIVLEGDRRTLTTVIALIVIQFFLLGVLILIQITPDKYNQLFNLSLIYLTIFFSFLALVSIIRLLVRTREHAARMTQEVYVEEINDMFTSIRGQRHDFLNHVQVIHTMVQMGKTDQLRAYVADLVKETRDVSDIVHHSSPALAAFIQAKVTVAIGKGITFTYEMPDDWNTDETTIRVIDIIKIMGNLVDNAFDETSLLPQNERQVHASILIMKDNTIKLQVSNSGRMLNAQDKERIFLPGYTTKGEGHSGLGLAIVQERVKHYRGELDVHSDENSSTTEIRITLPKHTA